MPLHLSIVVPVFNEIENIDLLYQSICQVMDQTDYGFELILIDDGSTDGSRQSLVRLADHDSRVRVVCLRRNFGQTIAMQCGIERASGEVIVTLDADLQNDPNDIPNLVAQIYEGHDLVSGWRKNRQDRLLSRKIPSRIANWLIRTFIGIRVHDLGCTLRAYRSELIRQIPLYADMHRFIAPMCSLATDRIAEVEVSHHHRKFGQSKYGLSRIFRVLVDAFTLKMLLSCSQRPFYWFAFWALGVFVLAGVAAAATIAASFQAEYSTNYVWPGITFLLCYLGSHLLFAGIFTDIVIRSEPSARIKPLLDICEIKAFSKEIDSA